MKKYISKTDLSLCVALSGGETTRVSFSPLTDGGSVFYTDDKEIQWGLEHHYRFGKAFEIDQSFTPPTVPNVKAKSKKRAGKNKEDRKLGKTEILSEVIAAAVSLPSTPAPQEIEDEDEGADEGPEEECVEEGISELTVVKVSDPDAAKDYLAEKFEVVRTKLKSKEIIDEVAAVYGIKFEYE